MQQEKPKRVTKIWTIKEVHDAANMWMNGISTREIGKKYGVTSKAICAMASVHRDLFPRRRSKKRKRITAGSVVNVEVDTAFMREIAEVAASKGVSRNALIRNALVFARQNGYPFYHIDAAMPEAQMPVDKLPTPRKLQKKLIPYAGKSSNESALTVAKKYREPGQPAYKIA